jgi:dehydrogenase/reductase SDR family protein 12
MPLYSGMYNSKFPDWEKATCTGTTKYDGQFAYVYAKRGQVLLCERWTAMHPTVKFVSCHPGWTQTEAVDAGVFSFMTRAFISLSTCVMKRLTNFSILAYGDNKRYLEPLRTTWEGAEGIAYLCVVDPSKLEGIVMYV